MFSELLMGFLKFLFVFCFVLNIKRCRRQRRTQDSRWMIREGTKYRINQIKEKEIKEIKRKNKKQK